MINKTKKRVIAMDNGEYKVYMDELMLWMEVDTFLENKQKPLREIEAEVERTMIDITDDLEWNAFQHHVIAQDKKQADIIGVNILERTTVYKRHKRLN